MTGAPSPPSGGEGGQGAAAAVTWPDSEASGRKLGRYELVHELGRGGMATVYLARARGPGGFLKWLAIKTIHPHLARERRFVDMFLDEARIAAAIQHPNVCQVVDLGEERDEYFIAMEYLHGEHLGALGAEASRRLGGLPVELGAHIVAEVARGLHHAHEAKDARGRPLDVVHRDISPKNIFVAYDGTVKITDFGVAKAAGRIAATESGSVKGKWAYMSPEQVQGEAVDRRSDVFALGIVLWEVTTGRRLFHAESEMRIMMRITSGRTPRPSDAVAGYPEGLERVVMRALERRPADRYQTAAEMAEDLDASSDTGPGPGARARLAETMERLFEADRRRREAILERVADRSLARDGDGVVLPAVTVPPPDEPSTVAEGPASAVSHVTVRRSREGVRRRATGWLLVALAGLTAAAAGAVLVYVALRPGRADLHVASTPSGARVLVDGEPRGSRTPTLIEDVAHGRHRIELLLDGHEPLRATFDVAQARVDLTYRLTPSPAAVEPGLGAERTAPAAPAADGDVGPGGLPGDGGTGGDAREGPAAAPAAGEDETHSPRAPPAYLNLIAEPWARVWVNGRPVGQTPLLRQEIPSGRVTVRLQREGHGEVRTLRLRARPGETLSRRVTF